MKNKFRQLPLLIVALLLLISCQSEDVLSEELNVRSQTIGTTEELITTKYTEFSGRIRRIRIREEQGGAAFRTIVVVSDDTQNQVSTIEMKVENPLGGPAPVSEIMIAEFLSYDPERQISRYGVRGLIFEGRAKPIETKYTMTAQMKAADGSNLGGVFSEPVQLEKSVDRIHRIRIRETSNVGGFRIIVDEHIDPDDDEAKFVKIVFNDTNGKPSPIPSTAILTLSEIFPDKNLARYLFKPLTFEGGAKPIETIYNITATMLTADGTPADDPVTRDVLIEATSETNQKFEGARIFTQDGGNTWLMEAKFKRPQSWVENVEVQFNSPFEGPKPANSVVELVPVREESDAIVVYSSRIDFGGDPTGFIYDVTIVATGGARRTHPIGLRLGISKGWDSNWF